MSNNLMDFVQIPFVVAVEPTYLERLRFHKKRRVLSCVHLSQMLQRRIHMFSGIVESVQPIVSVQKGVGPLIRISVRKPSEFNDLKAGDSISTDGVCLTVESFNEDSIQFALAAETLKILKWSPENP